MGIQNIDFGTGAPNDGDKLEPAWRKVQANFEDVYAQLSEIEGELDSPMYTGAGEATPRALQARLRDVVSLGDYAPAGDFNVSTDLGTSNNAALTKALAAGTEIHVPTGNYLFSTFELLSQVMAATVYGPGKLYYDNGSTKELIGSFFRAGICDPNGNLGSLTGGGVVLGGEGPGTSGMLLGAAHNAWPIAQPMRSGSAAQWQVYHYGFIGRGQGNNGTNQIDATYADFSSPHIEVGDVMGFAGMLVKLASKPSDGRVTVTNVNGSPLMFSGDVVGTWRHCYYYADGTCDANGTAVTRKTGDYFFDHAVYSSQKFITIAGVRHDVAAVGGVNSITISGSAGVQTNVAFVLKMLSLARETTLMRLQDLAGSSEETFVLYNTLEGDARIATQYGGSGEYRDIVLSAGDEGANELRLKRITGRVGLNEPSPDGMLHASGANPFHYIAENTSTVQFHAANVALRGPSALGAQGTTVLQHGNNNGGATEGYFAIGGYSYDLSFQKTLALYDYNSDFWGLYAAGTERARLDSNRLYLTGALDLGHASDTTLARISAGRVSIEGNEIAQLPRLAALSTGDGAALVGIEDGGSYFSGATVESALQYLGGLVAALDQAVVLKGTWDASAGTFPGSGAAQAGWSYIVSVSGTVGGVVFTVGDRVIAISDNASTTVYASNWFKADYTDLVSSVAGRTGAVVLATADISDLPSGAHTWAAKQTIATAGGPQLQLNNTSTTQFLGAEFTLAGPAVSNAQAQTRIAHGNLDAGGGTSYFTIAQYNDAGSFQKEIVGYNYNTNTWSFSTAVANAMQLDPSGNLRIGGTSSPASATKALVMFNGVAPTGGVTDGVVLYAQDIAASSELRVRDEAGNLSTLSPHNFSLIPGGRSEDMAWAYYSERHGHAINVDMLKLARAVEQMSGQKLVWEGCTERVAA